MVRISSKCKQIINPDNANIRFSYVIIITQLSKKTQQNNQLLDKNI